MTKTICITFSLLLLAGMASAADQVIGHGCTTAKMIDWDCDGYGVGSTLGPDADDADATVNTVASWQSKYGSGPGDTSVATMKALLAVKGYTPTNIIYVSPTGNDSTCALNDITKPCLTVRTGATPKIGTNDAVIFRGGTFSGITFWLVPKSGADNTHRNVYIGYPGEKPLIISDSPMPATTPTNYVLDGLVFESNDYFTHNGTHSLGSLGQGGNFFLPNITFRNLEIFGYYDQIMYNGGFQNLLIEKNVLHDSLGEHIIYMGTHDPYPWTNVIFQDNILYNSGPSGHTLHINGESTGLIIRRNIMYGTGNGVCISLQQGASGAVIENNACWTVYNAGIEIFDYNFHTQTPAGWCCWSYDQPNNTIRNNTIYYDGHSQSGQTANGIGPVHVLDNSKDYSAYHANSACTTGAQAGLTITCHDLGHATYDNNIFVNVAANNAGTIIGFEGADCDKTYVPNMPCTAGTVLHNINLSTDTFRNNLFFGRDAVVGGGGFYRIDGSYLTGGGYKTYAQWVANIGTTNGAAVATGNIQASDPVFVAANTAWYNQPGNYNLQVQPSSPAIAAGRSASCPSDDLMGNARSNPCTIGAYEFGGTPSTFPLILSTAGAGTGTVTSGDGFINCGVTCNHTYASGAGPIVLTATPTGGSLFTGWSGDCAGTSTCSLTMSASHSAIATFDLTPTPPSMSINGVADKGVAVH